MGGELKHSFQGSPNTNELVDDMLYICFSCQNNALKNKKFHYNTIWWVFLYMSLLEVNKMSNELTRWCCSVSLHTGTDTGSKQSPAHKQTVWNPGCLVMHVRSLLYDLIFSDILWTSGQHLLSKAVGISVHDPQLHLKFYWYVNKLLMK